MYRTSDDLCLVYQCILDLQTALILFNFGPGQRSYLNTLHSEVESSGLDCFALL